MGRSVKSAIAIFAAAGLAGCTTAQPPPPAPRQQTWEEFKRDHPDTFIAGYQQSLAVEAARLRATALGEALDVVRALVSAYLPPGDYTLQSTGANAAVLRQLRVDDTANRLVRAGYRIRHLAAPQQARSLVSAAADRFGDADALVLFAPIVLVADLDWIDRRPDGSADLVWRVTEPIKSSPPVGTVFRLLLSEPMPSFSPTPGGPAPPPPPPNPAMSELSGAKRALFFLQPRETVVGRLNDAADRPAILFSPMPIDGEKVSPGYHSGTQETTLSAVRAAARAQLCSPGYVPVVAGGSTQTDC